jgi:hypothetical protein
MNARMRTAGPRVLVITLLLAQPGRVAYGDATSDGGRDVTAQITITKEDFHGWPNTYRLSNGVIEARVVTDIGPRIMDVRRAGGSNLLYVRAPEAGTSGEHTWVQRGGWRLWIAPERKETTYVADNSACQAEIVGATTLQVTGAAQPAAGIQKQIDVTLLPGEPRLRITSRIKNVSDRPLTYAAWSLPVLRPGGRAFVPLDVGPQTAFDAVRRVMLWSYTEIGDPRYQFGDRLVRIDHTQVKPAPPSQSGRREDESKIGVDSAQGWAAYLLDGTLFLKRFPHDPKGQYPDGGATIEVYSNHEFLELENLGPLTTIAPSEEIVLPEDWWLFANVDVPVTEAAALETLQRYVTRAPFD